MLAGLLCKRRVILLCRAVLPSVQLALCAGQFICVRLISVLAVDIPTRCYWWRVAVAGSCHAECVMASQQSSFGWVVYASVLLVAHAYARCLPHQVPSRAVLACAVAGLRHAAAHIQPEDARCDA